MTNTFCGEQKGWVNGSWTCGSGRVQAIRNGSDIVYTKNRAGMVQYLRTRTLDMNCIHHLNLHGAPFIPTNTLNTTNKPSRLYSYWEFLDLSPSLTLTTLDVKLRDFVHFMSVGSSLHLPRLCLFFIDRVRRLCRSRSPSSPSIAIPPIIQKLQRIRDAWAAQTVTGKTMQWYKAF